MQGDKAGQRRAPCSHEMETVSWRGPGLQETGWWGAVTQGGGQLDPAVSTLHAQLQTLQLPHEPARPFLSAGSRAAPAPPVSLLVLLPVSIPHLVARRANLGFSSEENRHNTLPSWRFPKDVPPPHHPPKRKQGVPLAILLAQGTKGWTGR